VSAVNEDNAAPRRRKLIEVALPLEAINREAAREKSIRHGHPSTLHLWWARRPLATARAVLFAQLVDDPSSRPDEFPTEEDQQRERARLFNLIERMVPWEATHDERIMREVREEIQKSCGGNPPPVLDPFAGGGSIPLEAQRLGLEAHASDLNPVPVLINRAMIEIPPQWADQPPVSPARQENLDGGWLGARGLAADVAHYARLMREMAEQEVGQLYPKVRMPDGTSLPAVAWFWARTVRCPNPACGSPAPLINSFLLCNKPKKKVRLVVMETSPGRTPRFGVENGDGDTEAPTVERTSGRCLTCGETFPLSYVRGQGKLGQITDTPLAIAAAGKRQRHYVPFDEHQVQAASGLERPDVLDTDLPGPVRGFYVQAYGILKHHQLFLDRQLITLECLSRAAQLAWQQAKKDALERGMAADRASDYARSVGVYLAMAVSRAANRMSQLSFWNAAGEKVEQVFARQALSFIWTTAEANPFSDSSGNFLGQVEYLVNALKEVPTSSQGYVVQSDARTATVPAGGIVSTDPPYYDNVIYSDLSDFFYVWLRQTLRPLGFNELGTVLTPKAAELVAETTRHASKQEASRYFEKGFIEVFDSIRAQACSDYPITVYYAFKQQETSSSEGTASTGWETMLEGLLQAGYEVTATWPMRTERPVGLRVNGRNSLASSIVLACRPRPQSAGSTTLRGFVNVLRDQLPQAVRDLQSGNVAPVDLAQSAIGPGIAVYSQYAKITEPDGSPMRVRTALALINDVLAEVQSEQEGDVDNDTRWCLDWFKQYHWDQGPYGDAETLSKRYITSISGLEDAGVLKARGGKVGLHKPANLSASYHPMEDHRISVWSVTLHLSRLLESKGGVEAAGALWAQARARIDEDAVRELAYLLYRVCDANNWSESGQWFNNLVTSWPDLQEAARNAERSSKYRFNQQAFTGNDNEEDQLF
jgi:putative DNA methylase